MEVVIYLSLLFFAFGAGIGVAWKLKLANKFVTPRELDRILAEQRVMRNLMDEELAIIAADNRKDLASFDRQLDPTAPGESPIVYLYEPTGPAQYVEVPQVSSEPSRDVSRWMRDQVGNSAKERFFREMGLLTGQVKADHSEVCACEFCLPMRHTVNTHNCSCRTCMARPQSAYPRQAEAFGRALQQAYKTEATRRR